MPTIKIERVTKTSVPFEIMVSADRIEPRILSGTLGAQNPETANNIPSSSYGSAFEQTSWRGLDGKRWRIVSAQKALLNVMGAEFDGIYAIFESEPNNP